MLGLSYKKNVADVRESRSFMLLEILESRGASNGYHDRHGPVVPRTREHARHAGIPSIPLTTESLSEHDVVLVSTDHDNVDHGAIARSSKLIVDIRNVFARLGIQSGRVAKA